MPAESDSFDSGQWLRYFKANGATRDVTSLPPRLGIDEKLLAPLVRSLQRFQIGETGDGTHLKSYAATTRDAEYIACIDLFVREEQEHARLLALSLASMGAPLLTWHWSDWAFTNLRRACGLRTAILTLFVAEVIGRCFYEQASRHVGNGALSAMFAQLVRDEIGHLRFHTEYARHDFRRIHPVVRWFIGAGWFALFTAGCLVFVFDHRSALRALRSSPLLFLRRAMSVFLSSFRRVL
jgi:hypothetical protein